MSIYSKALVTAAAVGASFIFPRPASAETPVALLTHSPVALTACRVDYRLGIGDPYRGTPGALSVSRMSVRFQNQRQADATAVEVRVTYDGRQTTIVDRGTFSTATTIAHDYDAFDGSTYVGAAPDACAVVAVRYADGSVWSEEDDAARATVANTR